MDTTGEFRACVKAARTLRRWRGIDNGGGGEDGAAGPVPKRRQRVLEHREAVLAAYTKQCAGIRSSIEDLRASLLASRRAYVGADEHLQLDEEMTDAERAQLDDEALQYLQDCRAAIRALPDISEAMGGGEGVDAEGGATPCGLRAADEAAGAGVQYARQAAALLRSLTAALQGAADLHGRARAARSVRDGLLRLGTDYSFDVDLQALTVEEEQAAEAAAAAAKEGRRTGGEGTAARTTAAAAAAGSSLVAAASAVLKDGLRRRRAGRPAEGRSAGGGKREEQGRSATGAAAAAIHSGDAATHSGDAATGSKKTAVERVVVEEDEVLAGLDVAVRAVLCQENALVLEQMDTFEDDVLRAESRVVELSRLQGVSARVCFMA